MDATAERLIEYLDAQFAAMGRVPRMFGSPLAVETQGLRRRRVRLVTLAPGAHARDPRFVMGRYHDFLARRVPEAGNAPLSSLLSTPAQLPDLVGRLQEFWAEITPMMPDESGVNGSAPESGGTPGA